MADNSTETGLNEKENLVESTSKNINGIWERIADRFPPFVDQCVFRFFLFCLD